MESRQSRASTLRIPFCSPRAGTKNRIRLPRVDIASDPKPETRISRKASLRQVPTPRPFERNSPSGTAGDGERFTRPSCRLADTCKEKKNMEKPKGDQCFSARGQDGGQAIRVPSVFTRGRLYTPTHRARGRRHPGGVTVRWLPIAGAPAQPEASRAWRRRATC